MEKKVIIEVGANDGGNTVQYLEACDVLYVFEPVPYLADKLRGMFEGNPKVKVIQKAVSDFNGTARFGISGPNYNWNLGCSSLNEFNPDLNELWPGRPDFNMIEYIDVDVIRLDDFIKSEGIENINYLHIDAQGSDLKVLQSLGTEIQKVKAGRCEAANTVSLYKDVDNSTYSIMKHLSLNGFYIKTIFNHHGDQIKIDELPNSTEEVDIWFESIDVFQNNLRG
jgi:FkbM family methyltransferase